VSRRTSRHSLLCGLSQARQHSLRNNGIAALVLGLVALLALLNTYLLTRRLEIRRVREKLISEPFSRNWCSSNHRSAHRDLQPLLS
jgi:hypothetical protein